MSDLKLLHSPPSPLVVRFTFLRPPPPLSLSQCHNWQADFIKNCKGTNHNVGSGDFERCVQKGCTTLKKIHRRGLAVLMKFLPPLSLSLSLSLSLPSDRSFFPAVSFSQELQQGRVREEDWGPLFPPAIATIICSIVLTRATSGAAPGGLRGH